MTPPPAPHRQRKSRRYIWQGLFLLGAGSVLLLCCKLSVSAWLHSALLLCGGGAILLGNGYMLYGLLHHADDRVYADEQPAPNPQADMPCQGPVPAASDATPAPSPQPAKHECG